MTSSVQYESDATLCNCERIIHHEFLPCGQMVNKENNLNVTERLREAVRRKKRWFVERGKTGFCIMTTLRRIPPYWFVIFSSKMRRRSYHSVHTSQTLHQQTSFSSPNWNPCWRKDDLSLSRKLKKIRWYSYAVFQKRHFRNVSKMEETLGAIYKSEGKHFQRDRVE
jgi:hypothetical protein